MKSQKTSQKTSSKKPIPILNAGRAGRDPSLLRAPALERGTVEHYQDPELYDHEYRRRRADVNWYRAMAGGRLGAVPGLSSSGEGEVLELGCGSGRLLLPLVRDGLRVVGVDLARPMLDRCRDRLERLPAGPRERAELVHADFRALSLGRRFPLILAPFNAMMHLYTRADVERFLDVVRAHLRPDGVFAFDVLNPDLDWLVRDPSKRWARTRYKDPRTGRVFYYSTNHFYDRATQINWIRLYYDDAPGGPEEEAAARKGDLTSVEPPRERRRRGDLTSVEGPSGDPSKGATAGLRGSRTVELAQRQFFPEELLDLLHYNGFSVDERAGGFVGEPFIADSDSQVCRCSIRKGGRR